MSVEHPIIAVTGASGAGTTVVQQAFKEIFFKQKINAAFVQGDGFLRYTEKDTEKYISQALADGQHISCYGPDLNDFSQLEACFEQYDKPGSTSLRHKVNSDNAHLYSIEQGNFTDWEETPPGSDCLFYEGMHGGVVAETWTRRKSGNSKPMANDRRADRSHGVNAAQYVDLLVGVVPAINLEAVAGLHLFYSTAVFDNRY